MAKFRPNAPRFGRHSQPIVSRVFRAGIGWIIPNRKPINATTPEWDSKKPLQDP